MRTSQSRWSIARARKTSLPASLWHLFSTSLRRVIQSSHKTSHGHDTGRPPSRCRTQRAQLHIAVLISFWMLQHYLWASGHFLLLASSVRYLLAWSLFRGPAPFWYKGTFYTLAVDE